MHTCMLQFVGHSHVSQKWTSKQTPTSRLLFLFGQLGVGTPLSKGKVSVHSAAKNYLFSLLAVNSYTSHKYYKC